MMQNFAWNVEIRSKKNERNFETGTKLVPAKCTACGASVQVNPNSEIATCPFCGNNYIVEKAINIFKAANGIFNIENATINIINGQLAPEENERDPLFAEAGRLVIKNQKGSIGMLQRLLKQGFNRTARIMAQLEEAGVISCQEGTKPRRVLMDSNQFERYLRDHKY